MLSIFFFATFTKVNGPFNLNQKKAEKRTCRIISLKSFLSCNFEQRRPLKADNRLNKPFNAVLKRGLTIATAPQSCMKFFALAKNAVAGSMRRITTRFRDAHELTQWSKREPNKKKVGKLFVLFCCLPRLLGGFFSSLEDD